MKLLLISLSLIISTSLFAEEGKGNGERFEKVKGKVLERMDKHIATLQTARSCASSASDKAAMKSCREPLKSMRQEFKKKRETRRERRKNRKEKKDKK